MKKNPPILFANRSGSTLAIALMMLAVLSLVGANVLLNVTTRYNGSSKAAGWQEALFAAEAGADVGLANCRWTAVSGSPTAFDSAAGWTGPDAQGVRSYRLPTIFQNGEGTNVLWATVQVDTPATLQDANKNQWYRIRSTGYAQLPGLARVSIDTLTDQNGRHNNALRKFSLRRDRFTGAALSIPQATRTVEIIAQPKTPFSAAVVANTSFSGPGSAGVLDSFDSRDPAKSTNGQYDPGKFQQHGDIIANTADFSGGGDIWGNVGTNGGNVQPSSSIHGQINNSVSTYVPPVATPTWTVIAASPRTATSTTSIQAGTSASPINYKITPITGDLTINLPAGQTTGTVNIWVPGDTGGNELSGAIHIAKGVTAKIYIEGDINLKARDLDNQNYNAAYLQIYGLTPTSGNRQSISIGSPGSFYGAIYAPSADIKFTGNADIMGAIVGNNVSGNGNTSIHYDEALAGFGPVIDFRRASWIEDER